MFVVCFGDGLGNQMFQYAFYKSLQHHYPEVDVTMDIFHIYGKHIHNGFELDRVFGIKRNECNKNDAYYLAETYPPYLKRFWFANKLHALRRRFFGRKSSALYQVDPTSYHESAYQLNTLQSYMLRGNWINPRYFEDIKEQICKEFTFIRPLTGENLKLQSDMANCNSVSIHVRRGDYLKSSLLNLTMDYYREAITIIENKVEKPVYYIFSDDKEYIADQFGFLSDFHIVSGNIGEDSYIDMQLMSCCKHNIIANSTFSFWGAYLNTNIEKVVVAPNKVHHAFRNPIACQDWNIIEAR